MARTAWATMTRGGAYRQRPVTAQTTRGCQGVRAERDDHRSNRRSGEPVEDSGLRSREPVWGWIADPIWASGDAAAPTGRTHDRYRPDCRTSQFFALASQGPSTHALGPDPRDERCFLPIHIYAADTGHCVLTILRPGKTPGGKELSAHLRRLVRRIRLHWPNTRITIRSDGHYGRREAMDWCETHGVQYIFGLSTNTILAAQVFAKTDEVCVRRAIGNLDVVATTPRPDTAPNPGRIPVASWLG